MKNTIFDPLAFLNSDPPHEKQVPSTVKPVKMQNWQSLLAQKRKLQEKKKKREEDLSSNSILQVSSVNDKLSILSETQNETTCHILLELKQSKQLVHTDKEDMGRKNEGMTIISLAKKETPVESKDNDQCKHTQKVPSSPLKEQQASTIIYPALESPKPMRRNEYYQYLLESQRKSQKSIDLHLNKEKAQKDFDPLVGLEDNGDQKQKEEEPIKKQQTIQMSSTHQAQNPEHPIPAKLQAISLETNSIKTVDLLPIQNNEHQNIKLQEKKEEIKQEDEQIKQEESEDEQEDEQDYEQEDEQEQDQDDQDEDYQLEDDEGYQDSAQSTNISQVQQYSEQDLQHEAFGAYMCKVLTNDLIDSLKSTLWSYDSSNYFHVGPRYEMLGFLRSSIYKMRAIMSGKEPLAESKTPDLSKINIGCQVLKILNSNADELLQTCSSYNSSNYFHVGPRYHALGVVRKIIQVVSKDKQ